MRRVAYPAASRVEADLLKNAYPVGCILESGTLTPALTPVYKGGNAPDGIIFSAFLKSQNAYVLATANGFFISGDGVSFGMVESFPVVNPFAFEEGGVQNNTVLACEGRYAKLVSGGYKTGEFGFGVRCGVIRHGRLFAADARDGYKLRWSGTDGAFDWTESPNGAGSVNIEPKIGEILRLAVFRQRVVAVCENGLAYLNAYGIAENFKLVYIDGATGKIDANSVAAAGNKLLFTVGGKPYAYDGVKAERLEIPLLADAGEAACAAGRGENYFLAAYSKSLKRRVVFVVNAERLTAYVADVPANAVIAGEKTLLYSDGGAYSLEEGGEFTLLCPRTNFNARGRKTFKGVVYEGGGDVTVEVKAGGKSRISRGVAGYCPVNSGGRDFEVTVRGTRKITLLKAVSEVIDDV